MSPRERGFFPPEGAGQKATQTVTRTLEVSRSGLYTLLAELRKDATP